MGLLLGIPTLIIFMSGLVLVGTGLIRPPSEEYIAVETQRVETRNAIINPTLEAVLPRSTDDALNFAAHQWRPCPRAYVRSLPRPRPPAARNKARKPHPVSGAGI